MNEKFPKVIRIEPSGVCNLKCIHCPTGTKALKRGLMTDEIFEKVYETIENNLSKIKVIVMYHGGEPLLNEKIYDWIHRIKELKSELLVKIVSNGVLINEDVSQRLIDCDVDQIEISLDGVSFEQNDAIRRNSNGVKVVENVKALIGLKKKLKVNHPQVFIANTMFFNQKGESPEFIEKIFSEEIISEDIVKIKSTTAMKWPDYTPPDGISTVLVKEEQCPDVCDHVVSTSTIRWNGDVVPCCYDLTSKYVLGNILTEDFDSILLGDKYQALVESFRNHNYNNLCQGCNYTKEDKVYLLKDILSTSKENNNV